MGKKVLLLLAPLLVVIAAVSWAATTWQLQTKIATSGGTIKVRNNAVQTTVGSVVYTNFTTSANVPVYVNAVTGYAISSLLKNGSSVPVGSGTTSYSALFNKSAGTIQSLIASFAPITFRVTTAVDGPGSITTSGATVPYNGSVTITARPTYTSGVVKSVTVNGVQVPGSFPYPGVFSTSISNVTQDSAIFASFDTVTASAGSNTVTAVNQPVTLAGSASGGGVTSWVETGGPVTVDTSGWTTTTPTFNPTAAGTYSFTMNQSVGGTVLASSSTQVTVSLSTTEYMRNTCNGCHASPGGANPSSAFGLWSSSVHKAPNVNCVTCHSDGAMPTPVNTATVNSNSFVITGSTAGAVGTNYCVTCHAASIASDYNSSPHNAKGVACTACHVDGAHRPDIAATVCDRCHRDASGNVPKHPVAFDLKTCTTCHGPHSVTATMPNVPPIHYNNVTSAGYPASYMTSRSDCTNCHYYTGDNATHRSQWGQTGHADTRGAAWVVEDFKTRSGCVQCHTTTGFIAYSSGRATAAWGSASDKTKELLTCIGCHSDITTGQLRPVKPVTPFADDSYRNRDVGPSNICMSCHSGTNNGNSIEAKVGSANFNDLAFIPPHYLASGGTIHGRGGYHFPGQTYAFYSSNSHRRIGMGNQNGTGTGGPCVACHMSSAQKHLFQAAQVDQSGTVTAVASTLCVKCHGSFIDAKTLNSKQSDYDNALEVLRAMLDDRGIVYSTEPPYFSNRNWGTAQAGADVMGAAYNYQLLVSEPGAYAHNAAYAKKLISDSIDTLYNGTVTGSIDSALAYLVTKGAITQSSAESLTQYTKNTCTSCHGGTTSTTTPMNSNGHPGHLSADYGPAALFGNDLASCEACHVYGGETHGNGTVNMVPAACTGCHPNGATWTDRSRLDCATCHAQNPSTLPNGAAAPYKPYFAAGHGQFPAAGQCASCHDPNSRHITGALGTTNRLTLKNDDSLCASCHNDAAKVRPEWSYMRTHNGFACLVCHDPHGTSNLWMIKTAVSGNRITYTKSSELTDPVTNRGLCQGCHTKTKFFRAGEPEAVHYPTSNCIACHTHNDIDNGFHAVSDRCDACHGYPPAPRTPNLLFGAPANWLDAKFEDYSGGGGAHLAAVHISPYAQASDGWIHCTMCHNGGRIDSFPNHVLTRPTRSHIENVNIDVDRQYRFAEGFTIYTGSKLVSPPPRNQTGSCFNISCHMSPSPRWSTER